MTDQVVSMATVIMATITIGAVLACSWVHTDGIIAINK